MSGAAALLSPFPTEDLFLDCSRAIPSPRRGEGEGEGRQMVVLLLIPLILTFSPAGRRDSAAQLQYEYAP